MNELQLSNDLPQIEFEISHYQRQGAEAIFEIGRRLKHVKENNLQYGTFGKWLDEIGIDRTFAKRSMKISSELNIDSAHVHQLGIRALTQIVSLPEETRERKQQTSSGEMKTPYEMTNKEREEFKRQIKQRDEQNAQLQSQVEQAQRSEEIARKKLEDEQNREPEVVEKYTEPEDYQSIKNMNEHLESEREYYKKLADDFRNEVKGMMDQSNQEMPLKKEDDYEDYTSILLKILEPSEVFIENYKNNLNEQEIINKLEKIIKKLKEQ
ncbi:MULTISPECIES: DUF3102 domain-containing protein [Bacillati]|uniref:DUF3102 domain-containing protein n=1 Tax=Bacillati TaxID=1783272 RepID=UPI002094A3E7|nr:DUF3102 domain-containing protein [Staphylococcus epidermidis]MCO6262870.1 DUF3102 domain-containing protein [Staphylococcus epidermidis]